MGHATLKRNNSQATILPIDTLSGTLAWYVMECLQHGLIDI